MKPFGIKRFEREDNGHQSKLNQLNSETTNQKTKKNTFQNLKMKSFAVVAIALCLTIQGSLALNCFQCSYDPRLPANNIGIQNNPGCAENGDDISKADFSSECPIGENHDVCVVNYTGKTLINATNNVDTMSCFFILIDSWWGWQWDLYEVLRPLWGLWQGGGQVRELGRLWQGAPLVRLRRDRMQWRLFRQGFLCPGRLRLFQAACAMIMTSNWYHQSFLDTQPTKKIEKRNPMRVFTSQGCDIDTPLS